MAAGLQTEAYSSHLEHKHCCSTSESLGSACSRAGGQLQAVCCSLPVNISQSKTPKE